MKTLSGGQRRRLDLALALAGDPDLIFLDEPTTGFDPAARHGAWALISSLRGAGRTIVLTSHYMDEVQQSARRRRERAPRPWVSSRELAHRGWVRSNASQV